MNDHPITILCKALDEVFEKHQSLCLDNENEREFLKGSILGTFSRLIEKNEGKTNEPTSHN